MINPFSNFPLDHAFDGVEMHYLSSRARNEYNENRSAAPVQATREVDGVVLPVWEVELIVRDLAPDGTERHSSLTVRVASKSAPDFPFMAVVRLVHPVGAAYRMAGGAGGFSVRADGIVPAKGASSPAAAEAGGRSAA